MRRENKSNCVLLVIEQDAETRCGMKRLLEMNGCIVTAVADQQEAVLVARQNKYDLILFDSNLAPPDSLTAAYQVRRQNEFRDTPLLVISVHRQAGESLNHPEADKFTAAYLTELSRFDELEELINCVVSTGK